MTKKYLLIALVMFAGFCANAATALNSKSSQFAVPVLTGDYADPSIIKVEGMYYMGTGGQTMLIVEMTWKDGKVTNYRIASTEPRKVTIRVNGETKAVRSEKL